MSERFAQPMRIADWVCPVLVGFAVFVSAHDSATIYPNLPDPAWMGGWLAPGLSILAAVVWFVQSPSTERRTLVELWKRPAWQIVGPGAALAAYGLWYGRMVGAPIETWLQPVVSCAATTAWATGAAISRDGVLRLVAGLVGGGAAVCLEGIAALIGRIPDANRLMAVTGNRYASGDPFLGNRLGNGSLPYPTMFVSLLVLMASLALGLLAASRTGAQRALAIAAYLLFAVSVWLTASRGGAILLIVVTLAHLAVAGYRGRRLGVSGQLVGVGAAAGLTLFAGFVARLVLTKGSALRADGSLSSRVKMWRICWHAFRDNPVTGGGPGAFREGWRAFMRTWRYPEYSVPHSLYFGILCEGGLVLFSLAALLFVGLARESWRVLRSTTGECDKRLVIAFVIGLLSVLTHDLTENSFQMHPIYLLTAVFAGLIVGLRRAIAPSVEVY